MKSKQMLLFGVITTIVVLMGYFVYMRAYERANPGRVDVKGYRDRYGDYFFGKEPKQWRSKYSEGMRRVKGPNGKYGFVDENGVLIINHVFSEAQDFSEGLAAVNIGIGQRGYINKNGTIVIRGKYLETKSFSEGFAAVRLSNYGLRWGYIDRNGEMILEAKYVRAYDFKNGRAYVMEDVGKYKYIDANGDRVHLDGSAE